MLNIALSVFSTRWVSDSGQKGAVVTLVELEEEGEANSWRGVSQEVVLKKILILIPSPYQVIVKALKTLEAERKCEIFQEMDGVKFF